MIYIYESGVGHCKIGCSKDPDLRRYQIEIETGLSCTRFKSFEHESDMFELETEIHKSIPCNLIFGEWFSINFDDAELIVLDACGRKIKKKGRGSNHRQANLFKATHSLISDIANELETLPESLGKVSKADVVHRAVLAMHKKVVKK
jgi:hypothetical protein